MSQKGILHLAPFFLIIISVSILVLIFVTNLFGVKPTQNNPPNSPQFSTNPPSSAMTSISPNPSSSPTSRASSSPPIKPSFQPTPTPQASLSPIPSTTGSNKFSCDFSTFEAITDGRSFVGDPNLVKMNSSNSWTMIYGKANTSTGSVNLYSALLPSNSSLGAPKDNWQFSSEPIVSLSPGAWDATNIETGSYVYGWTPKKLSDNSPGWEERIYYAGRNQSSTPTEVGYPIGVLYKDASGIWTRHSTPILNPSQWWELGYGIGEPAMYYESGTSSNTSGKWHLYYQACSNKGLANGYPIADECFIAHRSSDDGINFSEPVKSSSGKPWIVAAGIDYHYDKIAFTGKPEIKVDSTGRIHWVTTDDKEKITYANAANLNSGITNKQVLFTANDCKNGSGRSWCNWKFETGPSFGFDADGSLWVYFTAVECSGADSVNPTQDKCPAGKTEVWRLARVHCNKQ